MRYTLILLVLGWMVFVKIASAEREYECVKAFFGVCVLEIRHENKAAKAEKLRRWWECVKLGLPGDTAHQDRCEEIVYGTGTTPDRHEMRR